MRGWIKTNVNKLAFANHTTLKLGVQVFRSYLKLSCEYELHILPNVKVSAAKDYGESYMKAKPYHGPPSLL